MHIVGFVWNVNVNFTMFTMMHDSIQGSNDHFFSRFDNSFEKNRRREAQHFFSGLQNVEIVEKSILKITFFFWSHLFHHYHSTNIMILPICGHFWSYS